MPAKNARKQPQPRKMPKARATIVRSRSRNVRARVRRANSNPTPRNLGRLSLRPPALSAARYCAALIRGNVYSEPELPCGSSRSFREVKVTWTLRPIMSDATRAIVVFNPHLMWTDQYVFNSGVDQFGNGFSTGNLAPMYNPTTSSFVPSFNIGSEGAYTASQLGATPVGEKVLTNTVATSVNVGLSGDVRFVMGSVKFQQFETMLNTGGSLYYVHNTQDRSLIGIQVNQGTTTATSDVVSFYSPTPSQIENIQSCTAITNVTPTPIDFTIFPHTTEFEAMTTYATAGRTGGGAPTIGALANTEWYESLKEFFPDQLGEVSHKGWNQAIIYKPANLTGKTVGSDSNCLITFEGHYHVNVNSTVSNSWPMTASTQTLTQGVSDPRAASAMQTTIDGLKQARVDNSQAVFNRHTDTTLPVSSALPGILGTVAKAAPEIADGIASLMPPGIGRTILSGAASLGRALFG